MRDVARLAYANVAIGAIGWIRPDPSKGETLEAFQSVVLAANSMQSDGLILVRSLHRESLSGRNFVDAIEFIKIR